MMDDGKRNRKNSLGNIAKEYSDLIDQAATETGFNVWTQDDATDRLGHPVPDCVHVVTAEPARDHGLFWQKYRQLKADQG